MLVRLLAPFVATAALAGQQVSEAAEPNQTLATATPIACGVEVLGSLSSLVDVDWYTLTLAGPTDLRLETGPGLAPSIGDTLVSLLDDTGAVLQLQDDGLAAEGWSRLFARGLAAGNYVVAVERGSSAASQGSYVLDVRCAAPTTNGSLPIVAETVANNDPRLGGAAQLLGLPARCNGTLSTVGAGGDWDFYRVTLAATQLLQVRVAATATHPQTPRTDDPVLYVFDAAVPPNVLVGPVHGSDFGVYDAGLDVRLPAGTYQVAIRGRVGSTTGRYYLDLQTSPAAKVVVAPGGCGGRVLTVASTTTGLGAPQPIERPVIGSTFTLLGQNLDGNGSIVFGVGFVLLGLDLTPLGAVGCTLELDAAALIPMVADATGQARLAVPLPETPSLVGAEFHAQVATLDGSNPVGGTLSNLVTATLGN